MNANHAGLWMAVGIGMGIPVGALLATNLLAGLVALIAVIVGALTAWTVLRGRVPS
jgi:ABC-type sulfate transport system permease component